MPAHAHSGSDTGVCEIKAPGPGGSILGSRGVDLSASRGSILHMRDEGVDFEASGGDFQVGSGLEAGLYFALVVSRLRFGCCRHSAGAKHEAQTLTAPDGQKAGVATQNTKPSPGTGLTSKCFVVQTWRHCAGKALDDPPVRWIWLHFWPRKGWKSITNLLKPY
jgi:hypothetical protein